MLGLDFVVKLLIIFVTNLSAERENAFMCVRPASQAKEGSLFH